MGVFIVRKDVHKDRCSSSREGSGGEARGLTLTCCSEPHRIQRNLGGRWEHRVRTTAPSGRPPPSAWTGPSLTRPVQSPRKSIYEQGKEEEEQDEEGDKEAKALEGRCGRSEVLTPPAHPTCSPRLKWRGLAEAGRQIPCLRD